MAINYSKNCARCRNQLPCRSLRSPVSAVPETCGAYSTPASPVKFANRLRSIISSISRPICSSTVNPMEGSRASIRRSGTHFLLLPAGLAGSECLVGVERRGERLLPGDVGGGIEIAGAHQLDQARNIFAVVAVDHAVGEILVHRHADRK